MMEFNRSARAIWAGLPRGEVWEQEMETVRPITNLVGCGNRPNPPVPCHSLFEGGSRRVGGVVCVKACVIPRSEDLQIR